MIKLFNSLGRQKQTFEQIEKGQVKMYVCGPTVYAEAHLGNMRAYIFADVLRRVLEFADLKVTEVMNITDVGHLTSDEDSGEDKIQVGAAREHLTVWQIAKKYTQIFKADIAKLNIESPTIWAKATDHIQDQIDFIKKIEAQGFTYKISDGLYFDTSKVKDYGILANLNLQEQQTGTRVAENREKKNPADFALWKFSYPNGRSFDSAQDDGTKCRQMEWPSPWGKGFPGWHIECSAMSTKYLGQEFDIHTGGLDHLAVHHTNEIAQSQAANGKIPARFWIHGAFLLIEGRKMAKSEDNFLTLSQLQAKGVEPLAFRYLALTAHYRSQLNFTWAGVMAAQNTLKSIRKLKGEKSKLSDQERGELTLQITAVLNDDLDTPKALALLHGANDFALWTAFESVLALDLEKTTQIPEAVEQKAKERETARTAGDFKKADELRLEIEKDGYTIEDTVEGTKISQK